jgi:hypothetical protein
MSFMSRAFVKEDADAGPEVLPELGLGPVLNS